MMAGSFLDTVMNSSESLADKRARKEEEKKAFVKPSIDEVISFMHAMTFSVTALVFAFPLLSSHLILYVYISLCSLQAFGPFRHTLCHCINCIY